MTVFGVGLYDPLDAWEVACWQSAPSGRGKETSAMYWSPSATVSVPAGYAMTGGGCFVDLMQGPGVLLTASYPSSITTWECNASWHIGLSKARMTAYVVGIRPRDGTPPPSVQITSSPSAWAAHPSSDPRPQPYPVT